MVWKNRVASGSSRQRYLDLSPLPGTYGEITHFCFTFTDQTLHKIIKKILIIACYEKWDLDFLFIKSVEILIKSKASN